MIVIRVELWPLGDESKKETLVTAHIINDGTGTPTSGNYDVKLFGKRGKEPVGTARVLNWARKSRPVWGLIGRALFSAVNDMENRALRKRWESPAFKKKLAERQALNKKELGL